MHADTLTLLAAEPALYDTSLWHAAYKPAGVVAIVALVCLGGFFAYAALTGRGPRGVLAASSVVSLGGMSVTLLSILMAPLSDSTLTREVLTQTYDLDPDAIEHVKFAGDGHTLYLDNGLTVLCDRDGSDDPLDLVCRNNDTDDAPLRDVRWFLPGQVEQHLMESTGAEKVSFAGNDPFERATWTLTHNGESTKRTCIFDAEDEALLCESGSLEPYTGPGEN